MTTKFSTDVPEIYYALRDAFGADWEKGLVITYGDTIYSKTPGQFMSADLIAHEETHIRQQTEMGAEAWYKKYIEYPAFRLSQEIEAYKVQVKYLRDNTENMTRPERRKRIAFMAKILSGGNYGNMITYDHAFKEITST